MSLQEFSSCLQKQKEVQSRFSDCSDRESVYKRIIEIGREQAPLSESSKTPENLVHGCQSRVYLEAKFDGATLKLTAESDALISQGLAALLTLVYNGEPPEAILKCPPGHLEALNIPSALTPSRSNGLSAIYLHIKQQALFLMMKAAT